LFALVATVDLIGVLLDEQFGTGGHCTMDLLPAQPLLILDYSFITSLTDRATEAFIRMNILERPVAVPIGAGLLWSVLQSLPTFLSSLL
jgi:hypothetical protein